MTRTATAFLFTVDRLVAHNPKLYFWTWTFRQVPYNDTWAMRMYHLFITRLCRKVPGLLGVRVAELHKSHGIHFHAICNRRIPIDLVRKIGWPIGFGQIKVIEVTPGKLPEYLAKYLSKGYRKANIFARRRRWGTIGGLKSTRCRDVEYRSNFTRNHKILHERQQIDYRTAIALRVYSNSYGVCNDWPPNIRDRYAHVCKLTGAVTLDNIDVPF